MTVLYQGNVRELTGRFRVWRPTFSTFELVGRDAKVVESWAFKLHLEPLDDGAAELLAAASAEERMLVEDRK